jgi:hypothetical protein
MIKLLKTDKKRSMLLGFFSLDNPFYSDHYKFFIESFQSQVIDARLR